MNEETSSLLGAIDDGSFDPGEVNSQPWTNEPDGLPPSDVPLPLIAAFIGKFISYAEFKKFVAKHSNSKRKCPISLATFNAKAGLLEVNINGKIVNGKPRRFGKDGDAERSFGWNFCGKVPAQIDGLDVVLQVTGNAVVIGSKEAV